MEAKTRDQRRAGPWPGWLRWYRAQGWWERDYRAWKLYSQGDLSYAEVGKLLGCSASTAYRGVVRTNQRMRGAWPPPAGNHFGG